MSSCVDCCVAPSCLCGWSEEGVGELKGYHPWVVKKRICCIGQGLGCWVGFTSILCACYKKKKAGPDNCGAVTCCVLNSTIFALLKLPIALLVAVVLFIVRDLPLGIFWFLSCGIFTHDCCCRQDSRCGEATYFLPGNLCYDDESTNQIEAGFVLCNMC